MANGNAYKHFMASRANLDEKKEYNIVGALVLVTVVVLLVFM